MSMTLFQSIQQIQAGMEQGIYTESDYKKLLIETVLSDQTIAIVPDDRPEDVAEVLAQTDIWN